MQENLKKALGFAAEMLKAEQHMAEYRACSWGERSDVGRGWLQRAAMLQGHRDTINEHLRSLESGSTGWGTGERGEPSHSGTNGPQKVRVANARFIISENGFAGIERVECFSGTRSSRWKPDGSEELTFIAYFQPVDVASLARRCGALGLNVTAALRFSLTDPNLVPPTT